jgi:hypothetical protein
MAEKEEKQAKQERDGEREEEAVQGEGTVPMSEFRRLYAEMKKWKEKYREMLGKDELLKEKDSEIERLKGELYGLRVKRALIDAAAANGAVDSEQVASLLLKYVQLDENFQPVVVDDEGRRRFLKSGSPLGVEGLVREFLAKYPHHRRALSRSGAGSVQSGIAEGKQTSIDRVQGARSFRELERIVSEEARARRNRTTDLE